MAQSPEFSLIERYFRHLGQRRGDVVLGVGDDCALLHPPANQQLAVSMDLLLAGRHFTHDTPAALIGHKALAVNLSDLAAMGAEPAWVTLGLSIPEVNDAWLEGFASGFAALAELHGVSLIGGDTVRGPLAVTVQIHGFVPPDMALRRDGAQPGDSIYVSGYPGEAAAALPFRLAGNQSELSSDPNLRHLLERLDRPSPRVELGMALRGIASAAIDISDGLAADLSHILEASGCGARLSLPELPISEALSAHLPLDKALHAILQGGDDYELCFCVAPDKVTLIDNLAKQLGLPLTQIGQIEPYPGLRLVTANAETIHDSGAGFDHFTQP